MRGPRLPLGQRLEGVSRRRIGLRPQAARQGSSRATGSSPIFTPATKAESGHDENVSFEVMAGAIGTEIAETLRALSLDVYQKAAAHARERGLILADTKFEWGFDDRTGELLLVDEVLTPDSSRYWAASRLSARRPAAVVRQAVREGLAGDDGLGQVEPAAAVAR